MPGKWSLHTFYSRDRRLSHLLPETRIYTESALRTMMNRYESVYIKPNMEHKGIGIMKAWKSSDGYKLIRVKGDTQNYDSLDALVRYIVSAVGNQPHIVQQSIHLAETKGRRYDIRVMMMRNTKDQWAYSGMLAKVAGPSSIVTNVNRGGGYATTVRQALESSGFSQADISRIEQQLIRYSYTICKRFNRYKYSSQIGNDFGVDNKGKLWLIEVNFDFPSHALFAKLADKTMYRLIKSRRASYLRMKGRLRK